MVGLLALSFFIEVEAQVGYENISYDRWINIHANSNASNHDEPLRFFVSQKEMGYMKNFDGDIHFTLRTDVNFNLENGCILAVNGTSYFNGILTLENCEGTSDQFLSLKNKVPTQNNTTAESRVWTWHGDEKLYIQNNKAIIFSSLGKTNGHMIISEDN